MTNVYLASYRDDTVSALIINSLTTYSFGGPLRRETSAGTGSSGATSRNENNRIIRARNDVFFWHTSATTTSRIYKFDKNAFYSEISSLNGLFIRGETIVGLTSSATATIVDSSVSGDSFLIAGSINGTFLNGETVVGLSTSANAILDSEFQQGGAEGFKGEWYVDHTISSTLLSTLSHTGLFAVNSGGSILLTGLYNVSGTQARAIKYDFSSESWSETENLGSALSTSNTEFGRFNVVGSSIIGNCRGANSTNTIYTAIYNPNSDTFSITTTSVLSGSGAGFAEGLPIIEWQGRIFSFKNPNSTTIDLIELAGGTWNTIISMVGSSAASRTNFLINRGGVLFTIVRNSLYLFVLSAINASGDNGWSVIKFTNKNSIITCDNYNISSVSADQGFDLSSFILPAALTPGADLTQHEPRWRAALDQSSGPSQNNPTILWHSGNPDGGSTLILEWDGVEDISDQPGVTYTWDGTTTVTYTPGGTVVQPDDWIGLKSDNQLFRVTSTSGGVITIDNSIGLTIPTGSTTSETLLPAVELGSNLGIATMAFSENIGKGGGERFYPPSQINIEIVGTAPGNGDEDILFKCYSENGSESVDVSFFFGLNVNSQAVSQCTLSDPSSGSLNGNVIEGIIADNSTTYTVTWDNELDGVPNGESRIIMPVATL